MLEQEPSDYVGRQSLHDGPRVLDELDMGRLHAARLSVDGDSLMNANVMSTAIDAVWQIWPRDFGVLQDCTTIVPHNNKNESLS